MSVGESLRATTKPERLRIEDDADESGEAMQSRSNGDQGSEETKDDLDNDEDNDDYMAPTASQVLQENSEPFPKSPDSEPSQANDLDADFDGYTAASADSVAAGEEHQLDTVHFAQTLVQRVRVAIFEGIQIETEDEVSKHIPTCPIAEFKPLGKKVGQLKEKIRKLRERTNPSLRFASLKGKNLLKHEQAVLRSDTSKRVRLLGWWPSPLPVSSWKTRSQLFQDVLHDTSPKLRLVNEIDTQLTQLGAPEISESACPNEPQVLVVESDISEIAADLRRVKASTKIIKARIAQMESLQEQLGVLIQKCNMGASKKCIDCEKWIRELLGEAPIKAGV